MARPSIVIGLGGTGQWVLTHLKKTLLETYEGHLPKEVRLLAFDTMPTAAAEARAGVTEKKEVHVGNVRLEERKEFIPLTGNGFDLGQAVAKGQYPHIGSWFDARYYLDRAMPALWDLATGAGQVRQFGRLAFFMNAESEIWRRIRQAVSELQKDIKAGNELELMIVASFAGGTGAGMFVDTGILARSLSKELGRNLIVRGFFVLPIAFGALGKQGEMYAHMQARSFAAWRELDRFMSMGSDYGTRRITYVPNNFQLDLRLDARPFDVCYIVDARRDAHSLNTIPPERGVFPAMAEFIASIIDEKAGREYTEYITTNVGGAFQAQSGEPRYSAFGTYTVKVPVYYAVQEASFMFLRDFLERWLVPLRDADKRVTGLSAIKNQEQGEGVSGKEAALQFLQSQGVDRYVPPEEAGSQSKHRIANTLFMQRVADIYARRSLDDAQSIQRDAEGGYAVLEEGSISPATYVGVLTAFPAQENLGTLRDEVESAVEAALDIWSAVPPSKEFGDTPEEAIFRFMQDIPAFMREHFGAHESGGVTARGRFGSALDKSREFQVHRFQELLQHWLLNTLNGTSTDPLLAKSGKLGFAYDFANGLVHYFDYFLQYLEKVRRKRDQLQLMNTILQEEEEARLYMQEMAGKKCLFVMTHPRAYSAQTQYLEIVQDHIQVIADDMVLSALRQTAEEMRAVSLRLQSELERWVQLLALGDEALNVQGLIGTVESDLQAILDLHEADKANGSTQRLLEVNAYQPSEEDLADALSRIRWAVKRYEDGLRVECYVRVPEVVGKDEEGNDIVKNKEYRLDTQPGLAESSNKKILSKLTRAYYREWPKEHYVVEELLRNPVYADPDRFAAELVDYSHPLLVRRPGATEAREMKSLYVRIKRQGLNPEVGEYARQIERYLKEHPVVDTEHIKLVESEDPHRVVLVRSNDNIRSVDFAIWDELRNAYLRHIQSGSQLENAARLHIFPAEVHAAQLEQQLPTVLNKPYRIFHPKVVMLLEYLDRVKWFFRAYAMGYIKREEGPAGEKGYIFEMPLSDEETYRITLMPVVRRDKWPDIFHVMQQFVLEGRDAIITNRYIDWDLVHRTILSNEKKLKDEGKLTHLYEYRMEHSLIKELEEIGKDMQQEARSRRDPASMENFGWGWDSGQEYLDLADVARLLYKDALKDQTWHL